MATNIETLMKPNGDQVLPRTRAKAVSMENGSTVEAAIGDINATIDGLPEAVETLSDLKLDKTGGTITGTVRHTQNHYVHQIYTNVPTNCYVKFATINITDSYVNQEIHFKIAQRGHRLANLYLRYTNNDNATPSLQNFETDNQNFWICDEGSGVWSLYAYCSTYDSLDILDFSMSIYNAKKMSITWADVNYNESLPSGAIVTTSRIINSIYYGDSLPSSAPAGAIFFKKVNS